MNLNLLHNLNNTTMDLVDQIRHSRVEAQVAPGSAPRRVEIAEIYPYHHCRYPDMEDLDHNLSLKRFPAPHDKLLEQLLSSLESHVSIISLRSDLIHRHHHVALHIR
jgi:hypothetical protein